MTQELIRLVSVGDTAFGLVRETETCQRCMGNGVDVFDGQAFQCDHCDRGRIVVTRIGISGQLLYGNRDQFKQLVVDEIARGYRGFILDLTRCGYIDSSGLGVLVSIARKIQAAGGTIVLENLNEDLQALFELTKLDKLFTIRRTNG